MNNKKINLIGIITLGDRPQLTLEYPDGKKGYATLEWFQETFNITIKEEFVVQNVKDNVKLTSLEERISKLEDIMENQVGFKLK